MTHLTQVTLDFATAARLSLRDRYDWHQAVWEAFPGRDGERREFLTRLDHHREGFRLLIVSPTQPVRPAWCPPDAETWKTKPIPETYFTRRRYGFQLCANPTKKVSKERSDGSLTKNGRRVPLGKREELVEWIKRKGEQGGFAVDEATLRTFSRGREYFEKNGQARPAQCGGISGRADGDRPGQVSRSFHARHRLGQGVRLRPAGDRANFIRKVQTKRKEQP